MGFWLFQSCDIEPRAILRCIYATKFNLAQQCIDGIIQSLSFKYKMENVLGELFELTIDFYFFASPENEVPNFMVEISPMQKRSTDKNAHIKMEKNIPMHFSLTILNRKPMLIYSY